MISIAKAAELERIIQNRRIIKKVEETEHYWKTNAGLEKPHGEEKIKKLEKAEKISGWPG